MLCLAKPFKRAEMTGLNVKLCLCMWELYKLSLPGWYIFLTDGSPSFSMATNAHFKENLLSEHSSYDKVSIVVHHVWIIYLVQFIVKLHSGTQEKHNGEIQLRSISKQAEDQEISWSGTEGRQVCAELGQEQGVSISDNQAVNTMPERGTFTNMASGNKPVKVRGEAAPKITDALRGRLIRNVAQVRRKGEGDTPEQTGSHL